jgi:hypothetical protein
MTTAISSYAKPDTVLLLDMLATDPWIDLSQHRTDLTDNTTYVSEANSARSALGAPREIAIVVTVESGQEGILAQLGDAGGYSWRVRISADMVEVAENSILRASVELPSASKSAQGYLIHWSIHEDGGGSVRHELAVCNLDTEEWNHAQATTGAGTMDATDTLTIGAGYSGASPFDGGLAAIGKVRIGRRFHSTAEAAEDWLGLTTPPAMTQVRRGAPLVPDRSTLDIADDGAFAGPAYLWSGHAFEQSDRRLVSPLVNLRVHDPIRLTHDAPTQAATESWYRLAPGSSAMYLLLPYLFCRSVPGKVNRAHVRLHVRQTVEIGEETAEVRYRVYSMAGLPLVGEPVPPFTYRRTAVATCSVNHGGTGAGEWLDLGALALQVDSWGMTWLAVGAEFDADSPLVADTRAYVQAVTVDPYALASGGGLDIALP